MMIDRNLKCAFAVALLLPVLTWATWQNMDALALFAGLLWGVVNLWLIAGIVENALGAKWQPAAWLLVVVKFPLLYGIGYLLLNVQAWNLWFLLAGPPLAFLIAVTHILWRFSARSA